MSQVYHPASVTGESFMFQRKQNKQSKTKSNKNSLCEEKLIPYLYNDQFMARSMQFDIPYFCTITTNVIIGHIFICPLKKFHCNIYISILHKHSKF